MDLEAINATILAHQPVRLTEAHVAEALAAAALTRDASRDGRRLAAACALSGEWPMSLCMEIAAALLPPGTYTPVPLAW